MRCPLCEAENADGQAYCGDCGGPLVAPPKTSAESGAYVDARMDRLLRERVRDQKVVEIETSVAIAGRLYGWGKLAALVAGVPIAIVLAILGALGIKTVDDVKGLATSVRADIEKGREIQVELARARTQVGDIARERALLDRQLTKLKEDLGQLALATTEAKQAADRAVRASRETSQNAGPRRAASHQASAG